MQQNNIYKHTLNHVVLVSTEKKHERGLIFRGWIEKFNSPKGAQNTLTGTKFDPCALFELIFKLSFIIFTIFYFWLIDEFRRIVTQF
jgi:hypothetical protein